MSEHVVGRSTTKPPRKPLGRLAAKRVVDTVLATLLVVAAFLPALLIAVSVRLGDRGPVFAREQRVGRHGRRFDLLTFRTTASDGEQRSTSREQPQPVHTPGAGLPGIRNDDPDLTTLGRFLRTHGLDELPQLLNVVRGQMSLVGPRPPRPGEAALYGPDQTRLLRVRPGVTGLCQVVGHDDLTWEQSMRLDLDYTENWTPLLDLQILARAARVALTHTGARTHPHRAA